MSKNNEIYAKVFESVIAEMEQGRAPWAKPWRSEGGAMPYNAITGRRYSGGNVVALWFSGMAFTSNAWLTFKQAIGASCVVRKGEKGTPVYFMSVAKRTKDEGSEEKEQRFFFAKSFTVFNVDQLEELEEGALAKLKAKHTVAITTTDHERNETADAMVAATGATIRHGGDVACFIPALDVVKMPNLSDFDRPDSYYSTLFHELTHWTGHESRLNRITPAKFGSSDYAFEELVAELGASFLGATFQYDTITQNAAYLRHWAKKCRETPDLLARAASLASRAVEFLAGDATADATGEESPDAVAA
jgi:antirestriction protein ArdC